MNTSHPKKSIPAIAVCLPRSSNNNWKEACSCFSDNSFMVHLILLHNI
jgi:hypothetical protein